MSADSSIPCLDVFIVDQVNGFDRHSYNTIGGVQVNKLGFLPQCRARRERVMVRWNTDALVLDYVNVIAVEDRRHTIFATYHQLDLLSRARRWYLDVIFWNFRSRLRISLLPVYAGGSESSRVRKFREAKFEGAKVRGSESSRVRKFREAKFEEAKVTGSESSGERKFQGANGLGSEKSSSRCHLPWLAIVTFINKSLQGRRSSHPT